MAYPVATTKWPSGSGAASPAFSGTFIPTVWSSKLLTKFYETTVLSDIANTDWEGEIQNYGDTVNIRSIPDVTIRDHQADQELVAERASAAVTQLIIDKGKYFYEIVDRVHRKQMDIDIVDLWSQDFAKKLAIAVDTDVLGNIVSGIVAANMGPNAGAKSGSINLGDASASPVVPLDVTNSPSAANDVDPVDLVLRLALTLDEQNVDDDTRWLVAPAWFIQKLKVAKELVDASMTGDAKSPVRNGRVGMIDRFTVYRSNLLTKDANNNYYIYAGHRAGLAFASQLSEFRIIDNAPETFGIIVQGLKVYGYKVVLGEAIAAAYCRPK